jgi:hypothetical protein
VLPAEEERELIKGYSDSEYLRLGIDRIPAIEDIRYYDKFDRRGNVIEKNHFILEEVSDVIVENINHSSGYSAEKQWFEKTDASIKVIYKVIEFKEKNPVLWEQAQLITDVN